MSRITLWAGLAVLFGAGVLTGVVGTSLAHKFGQRHHGARGPAAQHERILTRLAEHLSLTPAQQAAIDPIVTRAHVDILELRLCHQADIDRIMHQGMDGLKETLDPEQQAKLDQMYARLQSRWQASRSHLEEMKQRVDAPR